MALCRGIALDGQFPADPTPAGVEIALRDDPGDAASERRMLIPIDLSDPVIFHLPIGNGREIDYRKTDLRTSDGAIVYLREAAKPPVMPQFCGYSTGLISAITWGTTGGFD